MLQYYRVSAEVICLLIYVAIVLPWAFNAGTVASVTAFLLGVFLIIPYVLYFYIKKEKDDKETNQYLPEDTSN